MHDPCAWPIKISGHPYDLSRVVSIVDLAAVISCSVETLVARFCRIEALPKRILMRSSTCFIEA